MTPLDLALALVDRGLVPDAIVRAGIRRLCRDRAASLDRADAGAATDAFAAMMASGPVAPVPEAANAQHYEVPASFFEEVLGPRLKYSGCLFAAPGTTLAEAEIAALDLVIDRAEIADGQRILELGCGWGSLTLRMAERFPAARITAISNSASQRRLIEARAEARGLPKVVVRTCDANDFEAVGRYDRAVSVEMFEHMRNWPELLRRIARWLEPDGRLFLHVFAHRAVPYVFETEGAGNWMGRHFFTGGIMPSVDLLDRFAADLAVEERWTIPGTHYARTAEAWLENLDARRDAVEAILAGAYGPRRAGTWRRRWRVFFMACAELFGANEGRDWVVAQYRLAPVATAARLGAERRERALA